MNMIVATGAVSERTGTCPAPLRHDAVVDGSLQGWRRVESGASLLWLKGHLHGEGEARLVAALAQGVAAVQRMLPQLDGCFGLIVADAATVLAAADPIGSIPVHLARLDDDSGRWLVGGRADMLVRQANLSQPDVDAALSIGMAGYALGARTLVQGLRHLHAGEMVMLRTGAAPEFGFYSSYRPWRSVDRPMSALADELADLLRMVFDKMIGGLSGRPIMVPLSAGYDSRLVAAALKELRYPEVRCYAYGIPGNHEAATSRVIAERLGLPWTFIPVTPRMQSAHFASADHADFVAYADTYTSVPFNQDYVATRAAIASGYAPVDAVFVNGQSGDFITGNHIPRELWSGAPVDTEARWARLWAATRAKHFDLWAFLETPDHLARVAGDFRDDLERQGGLPADPALDWSLYEASEFIHRQSRYVVSGQRTYEHLGADWRLPLWDRDLVKFFELAPLAAKQAQRLYRDTLRRMNWGGVFADDIPVNRRNVRPRWLAPLRYAAKAVAAPLGREAWHRLERRYFAWHMDPVANYAVAPWSRVARDRRGFRNAVSWHTEDYLARHGVTLESLAAIQ